MSIETAKKRLSALIGGGMLAAVLGLYGLAGLTSIDPGEVGIVIKQYGDNKGMQSVTLDTGTTWIEPFIYDVVVYDTRIRQEILEGVQSNTADGQPISVDVSFDVGLLDNGVPGLHENVGQDYFDQIVYPAARAAIRNTTSKLSSDQIYTGTGRAQVQTDMSDVLQTKLEPMGIRIIANLRDVSFLNEDFVKVLEDKAKAAQQEEIQTRLAAAAVQSAIKEKNIAEGERFKREQAAEATKYELKAQGEGVRLQKEEEAKGILAVGQAEADVIKLKATALLGSGGELYRDIEVLGGLGKTVEFYGVPTGAPGTSTYIIDEALKGKIAVGGDGQ